MPDKADMHRVKMFHDTYHSFHYTVEGVPASSRLDRRYGTVHAAKWFTATNVMTSPHSDHDSVLLHLRSPSNPIRIKKPYRVYPVSADARALVNAAVHGALDRHKDSLSADSLDAATTAREWDALKRHIAIRCKECKQKAARRVKNTYRQMLSRLVRQLKVAEREGTAQMDSIEDVAALLDGLSLTESAPLSRIQRIRKAIAAVQAARAASKTQRRFRQQVWSAKSSPKALFQRTSTKFADNTIPTIVAEEGLPNRKIHEKADAFADAWTPIFCRESSSEDTVKELLATLEPPVRPQHVDALVDPISEEEVASAIKSCKAGKACGPDGLSNDFYRDYAESLTPMLTMLFNIWYTEGIFPDSFLEAEIFCLKKTGDLSNPLNYRPLVLLNTDYKIFTRVLATTTTRLLGGVIHPNQAGFVPGRQLHDTVDKYTAVKMVVETDPAQRNAITVLLDFEKAYDSLARLFLFMVLEWLGFPSQYITALRFLHNGTKVRFLVNGLRSRLVEVTSGIRQGCPLAPLLFILALDPLYRLVEAATGISGVLLFNACIQVLLKIAGYADDTNIYLSSTKEVPTLLRITSRFGLASGLMVNAKKTVVIALHPDGVHQVEPLPESLSFLSPAAHCRYLGIQVGSSTAGAATAAYTWTLATQQLSTRLRMAELKSLTQDQRATIAAAVILPKLLHIARHAWPTMLWISEMQTRIGNFVWNGVFQATNVIGSRWINQHVASLPEKGGLAVSNLKAELLAFAATEVTRWALTSDVTMRVVGDILFAKATGEMAPEVFLTLGFREHGINGLQFPDTMWKAGRTMLQVAGAEPLPCPPSDLHLQAHMEVLSLLPRTSVEWCDGQFMVDTSILTGAATAALREWCLTVRGSVRLEWLPHLEIRTMIMIGASGQQLDMILETPLLAAPLLTVEDVIAWRHILPTTIVFLAQCGGSPTRSVSSPRKAQLTKLAGLLLLNFPELFVEPRSVEELRLVASPADHPYILYPPSTPEMLAQLRTVGDPDPSFLEAHSTLTLLHALRAHVGPQCSVKEVCPHPSLTRLSCIWAGTRKNLRQRFHYLETAAAISRRKGRTDLIRRDRAWGVESTYFHAALTALSWRDIKRVDGITVWGERLLYQLKTRGLNLYLSTDIQLNCPHRCCATTHVTLSHVFWECAAASALWRTFIQAWTAMGHPADLNTPPTVLTFALPRLPPGFIRHMENEPE